MTSWVRVWPGFNFIEVAAGVVHVATTRPADEGGVAASLADKLGGAWKRTSAWETARSGVIVAEVAHEHVAQWERS